MPINRRALVRTGRQAVGTGVALTGAHYLKEQARQLFNRIYNRRAKRDARKTKTKKRSKGESRQGSFIQTGGYTATKSTKKIKLAVGQPLKLKKKFVKNVEKVINHTKNYGEYTYCSDIHLRQTTRDRYQYVGDDNNSEYLRHFTPRTVWDAASILFNAKAISYNGQNTNTGMLMPTTKLNIINSYATYYFKSTSNHVVNVEMLICRPKNYKTDDTIIQQINDSTDDLRNISNSWLYENPGFKLSSCTTLHKNWHVEVRRMKFLPGASSSQFVQGPTNKVYDGPKLITDNLAATSTANFNPLCAGSVFVTFRIINDITVCGGDGSETISAFPSSVIGGVACRQMVYTKMAAPELQYLTGTQGSAMAMGLFYKTDEQDVDQQVTYENPITTATNI